MPTFVVRRILPTSYRCSVGRVLRRAFLLHAPAEASLAHLRPTPVRPPNSLIVPSAFVIGLAKYRRAPTRVHSGRSTSPDPLAALARQRSIRRRSTAALVLALATIAASACADSAAPTDPITPSAAQPSFSSAAALPTLSGTLGVPSPYDPRVTVTLGAYPEKVLAKVTMDGLVTLTWTWGPEKGQPYASADPYGMFHHGLSYCYMNVTVGGSGAGSQPFVPQPCGDFSSGTSLPDVGSRPHAEGYAYLNGTVTASRPTKWWQYSSDCNYNQCWTYSGTQTVSVEPVSADLELTASAAAIRRGQTVTFTARVAPGSAGGRTMPFKVQSWRWVPDSGATTTSCAPPPADTNPATCRFAPLSSGTLHLDALVNGTQQTRYKYLSVVPCLTGDSLLDDSRLRRALRDALNGSNPNDPAASRRERGGKRLRAPDGSVRDTLYPVGPNDTPCSFNYPPAAPGEGTPLVAWHTHPFSPLDPNDPLPYDAGQAPPSSCPQLEYKRPPPPGKVYSAAPGPSPVDMTVAGGIPNIVVDKDNVWVVPADYPASPVRKYPRSGAGGCDPLSL